MSSVIWYLYEFARKSWAENFAAAKSDSEIMDTPSRFRDFPVVYQAILHSMWCVYSSLSSSNGNKTREGRG